MQTPTDELDRLRQSERLYRLTVENVDDAIFLSDDTGAFRYVCPNCNVIFGYDAAELQPRSLQSLFRSRDVIDWERLRSSGEIHNLETAIERKDGAERFVLLSLKSVDILGATVLAVCRDVTERRVLERQLRQTQKIEAMGLLASGVAHDLKNLLTVVGTFSQTAMIEIRNGRALEDLQEVLNATALGSALLRNLVAFLRQADLDLRRIDVNEVIEAARGLLAGAVRPVKIELRLEPAQWPVYMDPTSLQQVFLNIAINARDAMPDGGALTIATRYAEIRQPQPVACGEVLRGGRYVVVELTDTGSGMDEATLDRAFDPYFTTKGGDRSGLGLSTCFGIVKQARGFLCARSAPNRGSTFDIYLPAADDGVATVSAAAS